MKTGRFQLFAALALIAFGISLRLLPHPANFAPITAISIFGGAVLPRRFAVWVPLAAMALSDLFIGVYSTMWVTWGCYLLIALASSRWLRKLNVLRGTSLALASSLFFFVVTNFAVWVQSGMYARTWSGLTQCYAMALPFFRNTAVSDLCFTGLLFGMYALAGAIQKRAVMSPMQVVR